MVTATMADFFAGGGGSIPEPTYAGSGRSSQGLTSRAGVP